MSCGVGQTLQQVGGRLLSELKELRLLESLDADDVPLPLLLPLVPDVLEPLVLELPDTLLYDDEEDEILLYDDDEEEDDETGVPLFDDEDVLEPEPPLEDEPEPPDALLPELLEETGGAPEPDEESEVDEPDDELA